MLMSSISRHAVVVCSYVALDVHLSFPSLLAALLSILSPLILCIGTYPRTLISRAVLS
jgi:hypothetical protein